MSRIVFSRQQHSVTVYTSDGTLIGTWEAYNNTPAGVAGFPNGTYSFAWYNPHVGAGAGSATGSYGIFIFNVPGRNGLGIHSGRSGPTSLTNGCIRTTDDGMHQINGTHLSDPLTEIMVQ